MWLVYKFRADEADTATSATTATTAGTCTGNAATATKLAAKKTIALEGDVTGSAEFDGSTSISITATVANDSHTHSAYVSKSGNSTITGTLTAQDFITSSDRRLKKNIVEVTDEDAISTARELAKTQGFLVGTSSGANVWAAKQMAEKYGKDKVIVTILADRAERYFSTSLI